MFSIYVFGAYVENISSEIEICTVFLTTCGNHTKQNLLYSLWFFSISFGQSEESSNEVNCFFTDNAKILISELYYYTGSLYCS